MTTPKGPQTATFPAKSIAHAIELAAGAWCAGVDPKFVAVSCVSERAETSRRQPASEVDLVGLHEAGVWAAYERGLVGQA